MQLVTVIAGGWEMEGNLLEMSLLQFITGVPGVIVSNSGTQDFGECQFLTGVEDDPSHYVASPITSTNTS